MILSGEPVKDYIDSAVRHILLRQGVLLRFMRKIRLLSAILRKQLMRSGFEKLILLHHTALGSLLQYAWRFLAQVDFQNFRIILHHILNMQASSFWRQVQLSHATRFLSPL